MAEYYWPGAVLRPRRASFMLNERNMTTSPSVTGTVQVSASAPPVWSASYTEVSIRTSAQRLAFNGLGYLLQGMRNTVIVPVCPIDQPFAAGYSNATVLHSDDSPHDDGAPYYQSGISVSVSTDTAANATTLPIDIISAGLIQSGQKFSVNNWLYAIRRADYLTATTATLIISPPLREAVVAGDWVEFASPTLRMRLASDREMTLNADYHRFDTPTVNFVEDFS